MGTTLDANGPVQLKAPLFNAQIVGKEIHSGTCDFANTRA
jgi:hypothetical protein